MACKSRASICSALLSCFFIYFVSTNLEQRICLNALFIIVLSDLFF